MAKLETGLFVEPKERETYSGFTAWNIFIDVRVNVIYGRESIIC